MRNLNCNGDLDGFWYLDHFSKLIIGHTRCAAASWLGASTVERSLAATLLLVAWARISIASTGRISVSASIEGIHVSITSHFFLAHNNASFHPGLLLHDVALLVPDLVSHDSPFLHLDFLDHAGMRPHHSLLFVDDSGLQFLLRLHLGLCLHHSFGDLPFLILHHDFLLVGCLSLHDRPLSRSSLFFVMDMAILMFMLYDSFRGRFIGDATSIAYIDSTTSTLNSVLGSALNFRLSVLPEASVPLVIATRSRSSSRLTIVLWDSIAAGCLHRQSHVKARPPLGPTILVIALHAADKCITELEVERRTLKHSVVYRPLSRLSVDDG